MKITKGRVLAGLCLLSVVLMFAPAGYSRWLRGAFRPLLSVADVPGNYVTHHLRDRMFALTVRPQTPRDQAVRALEQQLLGMQQMLDSRDERIKQLGAWRERLKDVPCKLIEARVVLGEPLPLRDRKVVDAGGRQGADKGALVTTRRLMHEFPAALPPKLAVLGSNYVVGRILESHGYTATLQLATDPGFHMRGMILRLVGPGQQRTLRVKGPGGGLENRVFSHDARQGPAPQAVGARIEVWADGDGRQVVCRQVPADHGIAPGDALVTGDMLVSGESAGFLPFGLTIGKVKSVEPDKQAPQFVTVLVEPLADLKTLSEVYIVAP